MDHNLWTIIYCPHHLLVTATIFFSLATSFIGYCDTPFSLWPHHLLFNFIPFFYLATPLIGYRHSFSLGLRQLLVTTILLLLLLNGHTMYWLPPHPFFPFGHISYWLTPHSLVQIHLFYGFKQYHLWFKQYFHNIQITPFSFHNTFLIAPFLLHFKQVSLFCSIKATLSFFFYHINSF